MSKSEDQVETQAEEKKKSPIGVIILILILLAAVLGLGVYKNAQKEAATSDIASQEKPVEKKQEAALKDIATQDVENGEINSGSTSDETLDTTSFDLEKASTPRILGNPDAPLKISEHSSFTCPACAAFHENNFKKLKEKYIDTGKAYLVFDDFPRNRYDITVGAIARCVSDDSYFDFIGLIYKTQKTWLNEDYVKHVSQNAKLSGASDADIANCLGNEALYEALAKRQAMTSETHNIESTPSLVINDSVVISGNAPFASIEASLNQLLEAAVVAEEAPAAEDAVVE